MKYILTLITGLSCVAISNAQSPHRVEADKIVGIVGDKIILKSDVRNGVLDRRRRGELLPENPDCHIMEQALTTKALLFQAERDSIEVSDEEVEAALDNRIRGFIKEYGSAQIVSEIAGRTFFQLKEDLRQQIKEMMMVDRMSQKITGRVTITPQEVKKYFATKDPHNLPLYGSAIEMGEIVLYPQANMEMEALAIKDLTDLKQLVESGSQKFDVLARLYSEDKYTRDAGGRLFIDRAENREMPSFIDATFRGRVFRMKPGEISPVFKSKAGYHIVQLVDRSGDAVVVRNILRIPKVTAQETNDGINKLDTVRARIIAGTLSFGTAVEKYSEADTRLTGGLQLNEQGASFLPMDQLEKDLVVLLDQSRLKPGELSKPIAFTDAAGKQGVKLLYFKSRSLPHRQNLKDDYDRIAEEALALKKQQTMETWLASKTPSYYVMIDPAFNNCGILHNWMH
jgi:peptidyl-prolyl cis-trans isomerase SurA